MASYQRTYPKNGSYFYTIKKNSGCRETLTDYVQLLENSLREALLFYPAIVQAMVVLPDHLHLMLTFPPGVDYQNELIRAFKQRYTNLLANLGLVRALTPNHPNAVWQCNYWQLYIDSERSWREHVHFIHYNPVYHQLVERVEDWPHSTFHQYVEEGRLSNDWEPQEELAGCFGE